MTPKRRWVLGAVGAATLLLAFDLGRPAPSQVSARGLLTGIGWYRSYLSPKAKAMGVRCRFQPSCSRYAAAVVARDGALIGTGRTIWRIARCGPWTRAGTLDPP